MQNLLPNTPLQGGKYRIERVLGQGGFGITYLAEQTFLQRKVAIKELFVGGAGQAINDRKGNMVVVSNSANQESFDQHKEKFKKEATRLRSLNHPNLVKVHEFFEENGTAYYVMDYIDGESLRSKLNREDCLSEKLVLEYIQQLLPALEEAHNKSIWHMDIKPENIMVDKKGQAYLIDFGASKHIDPNGTLSTSWTLAYTKNYCPPEVSDLTSGSQDDIVEALKEIGPWTDIYSLGATMYNLLTGMIPPSSNRLYNDGKKAFSFPSNLSSTTQNLIVWMMKPNKDGRPQNVTEINLNAGGPETTNIIPQPKRNDNNQDADEGTILIQPEALGEILEGGSNNQKRPEEEAIQSFQNDKMNILEQYGFSKKKRKKERNIYYASIFGCVLISLYIAFLIIQSNQWEHNSVFGIILYIIALSVGLVASFLLGALLVWSNDKGIASALENSIKTQYIKDYIQHHYYNK